MEFRSKRMQYNIKIRQSIKNDGSIPDKGNYLEFFTSMHQTDNWN